MFFETKDLDVGYFEGNNVIHNVNFTVNEGEIVSIIGSNGAGKTTILKTLSGLLKQSSGQIFFSDQDISDISPQERVNMGISLVPEGKRLFKRLSVKENLIIGAYTRKSPEYREKMFENIYTMFPVLKKREKQISGTLSGGEQQMLAVGRALMSQPKLLMLDEPSLGIMPTLVMELFETITKLKNEMKISILLVEQNVNKSIEVADRVYVLQTGRIIQEGGKELIKSDTVRKAFLGI